MEEKPNPCRTPRKNPSPRKLVRINLELPQLQGTSSNVGDSDYGCKLSNVVARTSISSTSECKRVTKRQSTKGGSVDVKSKSFSHEDVLSIDSMQKASKRGKEYESRKRQGSDKPLERVSKRKKVEVADVKHSNASNESSRSKALKPASKSQAYEESHIHKDLDIQSRLQPKSRNAENSVGRNNCSAQVSATSKSHSHNTKQTDDLIGQNTEVRSVKQNSVKQRNSKMVSKDSSSERGNVCKRLFDNANEHQAKDRYVLNSVFPEAVESIVHKSNSDSVVMDLSLKSHNFSLSDPTCSLSSTSLTGALPNASKTVLASGYLSESCSVLDLSTVETDKVSDSVLNESSPRKNADNLSVSESEVGSFVKCEESRMSEGLRSSVVENLPDENAKASSGSSNSSAYTTSEGKEELVDLRSTALLSPSDCAADADSECEADRKELTDAQLQPDSQLNDILTTPVAAADGIEQLADELGVLNQQSSYVATHMYRRQTPRRKRSFGIRQLSSGVLSESLSCSGTPFRRFSRRTPSKSSPRVTPRRPDRTVVSPLVAKLIFASPAARGAISSPLKMRTPSKPTAKRKLYSDSPEAQMEIRKPSTSTATSPNCVEKLPTILPLDVELNTDEAAR